MRPDRAFPILFLVLLAFVAHASPVSAQGIFEWFGGRQDDRYPRQNTWSGGERQNTWSGGERRDSWSGHQQRQYTPQVHAYSDPGPVMQERYGPASTPSIGGGSGRAVAYCVRLCDGRYFPMQRHANATSIQLCNAFCPAAKTQVFNGSQIDHAVASNGARYANLDNAFVYREKIVPNCTCNGKDAFGLARIDVAKDPTLRPGDIVASGDNQKAALLAAANKQVRSTVIEKPAALRGKAKDADPEAEEKPED